MWKIRCAMHDCQGEVKGLRKFCDYHYQYYEHMGIIGVTKETTTEKPIEEASSLANLYPKYHKDVSNLKSIDVYMVHQLFEVVDPSGCLQHSSKKLLLSGVRTGGKTKYDDIKEARDTLNRWLEINKP